jgi:hypothetical protein
LAAQAECENEENMEKNAEAVVAEEATIVQQTKIPVIASETVVETVDTAIVDEVCTDEQFGHAEEKVIFSFKSDYGEEDITHSLKEEVFVNTQVKKATLVSRVGTSSLSAEHLCFVELEPAESLRDFLWPAMDPENTAVFKELKRIR